MMAWLPTSSEPSWSGVEAWISGQRAIGWPTLAYHKFDWLLVGESRTKGAMLALERGVVNIPISLYDRGLAGFEYDTWTIELDAIVNTRLPVVVSLGESWSRLDLDRRRRLLERVPIQVDVKTCDQLSEAFTLSRAF